LLYQLSYNILANANRIRTDDTRVMNFIPIPCTKSSSGNKRQREYFQDELATYTTQKQTLREHAIPGIATTGSAFALQSRTALSCKRSNRNLAPLTKLRGNNRQRVYIPKMYPLPYATHKNLLEQTKTEILALYR
jgi:hypothetical protein